MDKVWVIIRKEWAEVFKNKFVLFTVAFMPLLFTAIPLVILYTMRSASPEEALGLGEIPPEFALVCGDLAGAACAQFVIVSQFLMLFLLMPVIIPVTIASYSIVGEKRTRTLEPLLATPISTLELLAGKALGAALPAVIVTWGAYALFVAGALLVTGNPALAGLLLKPLWLLAIAVVGPLLAVAAVSMAVMVSSRVNDPRVAEQVSALVMLPVLGFFMAQTFGLITINQTLILWLALLLLAVDAGLLALAIQLFQRETILTRWK
ncbi:MAG: ABC transporter permease subunit [Chloroflexi bacterium]|nr:ABC transporter permease subunit [Chloroflexota bacterium]